MAKDKVMEVPNMSNSKCFRCGKRLRSGDWKLLYDPSLMRAVKVCRDDKNCIVQTKGTLLSGPLANRMIKDYRGR